MIDQTRLQQVILGKINLTAEVTHAMSWANILEWILRTDFNGLYEDKQKELLEIAYDLELVKERLEKLKII